MEISSDQKLKTKKFNPKSFNNSKKKCLIKFSEKNDKNASIKSVHMKTKKMLQIVAL